MYSYNINLNPTIYSNILTNKTACRKYKPVYPSFTPIINTLSVNESVSGQYSLVYIFGFNFFPNGTTFVNFGSYKNIPVTFYSSNNISFVVPTNALIGSYDVIAVNIYNGNFSPPVKFTYPAVLNYSNSLSYTIL